MMKSPFKFLDSYNKEDKDRFFGREKETAQLYNAVFASNLTLLYGASGTGKTSLVNCGLGNKFYDTDWLPVFIRRNEDLNISLTKALSHALVIKAPSKFDQQTIQQQVKRLYIDHYKPVYLIFDQFEEIYILGTKREQQKFYQTISQLLTSGLQAKVLLIIREEWIAYLNEFEKIVPSLFDNRLRIEKMNDRNVYRVISGTAKYAEIKIVDPSNTIMAIINNLRDKREGIDLTNLQVYLDRLHLTQRNKRHVPSSDPIVFDKALVDEVGKMENVLSDFVDEQLEIIETKLNQRGVKSSKGLPLEILFTMVTDDGTKQGLELKAILEALPRNRKISESDLAFCMEEFKAIKIMRQLE